MDFSKLPTDNMYKFLAFSGLAILVFVIVYVAPKRLEIELDVERLKGKTQEIGYEIKHLQSLSPDEIQTQLGKIHDLGLKTIQLETTLNEISIRHKQIQFFRQIWWFIFPGASFLFLLGYVFWYFQVQRYQDKILKKQAADLSPPQLDTSPSN